MLLVIGENPSTETTPLLQAWMKKGETNDGLNPTLCQPVITEGTHGEPMTVAVCGLQISSTKNITQNTCSTYYLHLWYQLLPRGVCSGYLHDI